MDFPVKNMQKKELLGEVLNNFSVEAFAKP